MTEERKLFVNVVPSCLLFCWYLQFFSCSGDLFLCFTQIGGGSRSLNFDKVCDTVPQSNLSLVLFFTDFRIWQIFRWRRKEQEASINSFIRLFSQDSWCFTPRTWSSSTIFFFENQLFISETVKCTNTGFYLGYLRGRSFPPPPRMPSFPQKNIVIITVYK